MLLTAPSTVVVANDDVSCSFNQIHSYLTRLPFNLPFFWYSGGDGGRKDDDSVGGGVGCCGG